MNVNMKKIFLSLISISLLAVVAIPAMVLAATGPLTSCNISHPEVADFDSNCVVGLVSPTTTDAWGICCALNAVYTTIDWVFTILIAVVALFTILGAFDILTAAGDPEKVKKGRERIMYAMIGLAVALLSRAVPSLVKAVIAT